MIKHAVLLVIIFILSLSVPVLAAEPGSGVIEGQIVNGTIGSSVVTDQDLTLKTYLNDAEVSAATTKTDAEGRFVFDGLSTEPGYYYQVELTFQQAEYVSEWLSFDEGETTKFTEVVVYDSTTSGEAIKIAMSHTVIYIEQDGLWVEEYFLFVNEADRTYIGSEEVTAEGGRETFRFSLPNKATELQIILGLMECCIVGSEDGFADTMPVMPGDKEIAYSYKVDYNSGTYTFSRDMIYPIVSYAFLVEGEGVKVASDQLTEGEPVEIQGTWFKHLSGEDLAPDNTLVVQLSDLPQTTNQRTVLWVGLALVVLAGGFGFLLRRKRIQPVIPEGNLDQKRQRLLVELAQLDDDFEGGKIAEETYRRLRAETKTQLLALVRGLKEGGGNR